MSVLKYCMYQNWKLHAKVTDCLTMYQILDCKLVSCGFLSFKEESKQYIMWKITFTDNHGICTWLSHNSLICVQKTGVIFMSWHDNFYFRMESSACHSGKFFVVQVKIQIHIRGQLYCMFTGTFTNCWNVNHYLSLSVI